MAKNKIGFLPAPQKSIPDGLENYMSKVKILVLQTDLLLFAEKIKN